MTRRIGMAGATMAIWAILLLAPLWAALAAPGTDALRLDADTPRQSLEGRLEHFSDPGGALSFEAARRQKFVRLHEFRSLGYDTNAHWFHLELTPAPDAPERWVLVIGSPELEQADVWVQQQGDDYRHYAIGYHRPYANRPIRSRLSAVPVDVHADTQVYFRVRTTNAIIPYAELWQADAFTAHEARVNFYYGLYFGILLIAATLYALLGARLRDATMATYAGYIASQLLFHLGTSGYIPVLFDAPWLTDALPRIGWLGRTAFIVMMWNHLMGLKQTHPRIHRLYCFTILLNLALLPFALMPSLVNDAVLFVVKLANHLNVLDLVISMALLVQFWRRSRRAEWMIYLLAFVIPVLGTLVNTATNQGMLPVNGLTTAIYEIAPLVHVLVMSYGLALRLRQLQYDKTAMEQEVALATRRTEEQRRFVAMLSHEFGNPLAAIDRAAQMIQIKAQELPQAEAQRLAQIRAHAAMLSGFVDNFLATEALDHGTLALARKPCPIRMLLESAIRAQGDASARRIRLVACPDDAATFDLDATLIGVAIGNLLANALRYAPPDSAVELSAVLDDGGLRIQVADHGPGMSDEELGRLGSPYFRAASSLGKKGSGLGYHFTRRIVEAHGGQLTATRGAAGEGLAVALFLP